MKSSYNPPSAVHPMFSNALIAGGTFLQQNGNHFHGNGQVIVHGAKGGFECLKDAVAPAAFHNSGERFDPPKCHPNTRVAVMKTIMNWILRCDRRLRYALIMWLSGAAGAGKSAIAQSIAELCYAQGLILASFFFGRSDPSRNHAKSFFATIAYQLALVLPQVREKIVATVEYDPLIFTRSLSTQFTSLIVEPLRDLIESGFWNNPSSPRLIVIDGLDECLDCQAQCAILDTILIGIQAHQLPLIFLVASRPEHDLSTKFSNTEMNDNLSRLILDHSYLPNEDIEIFLRDKFQEIKRNHPIRHSIPSSWPTDDNIQTLVQKSSGQFIYASTTIKYVKSSRHKPVNRLEIILNLRPPSRDLPFAELDELYTCVFASVAEIQPVLDILTFKILDPRIHTSFMEAMLSLDPGDIKMLFCDLGSLISLDDGFVIEHASLSDFLVDKNRSKELYINIPVKRIKYMQKCFRLLSPTLPRDYNNRVGYHVETVLDFLAWNFENTGPAAIELRDDILHFSVDQIYKDVVATPHGGVMYEILYCVIPFLTSFFKFLQNAFADAPQLYAQHFQSFDRLLKENFDFYYSDTRLTALVALFMFSMDRQDLRPAIFSLSFQLFGGHEVIQMDKQRLCLLWAGEYNAQHVPILEEFLKDPVRSGNSYVLDGRTCATTALYCLEFLCDRGAIPRKTPTKRDRHDNRMKRNIPWLWRKRFGQHGVLRRSYQNYHRKKNNKVDIMIRPKFRNSLGFDLRNPIIAPRVWSRKYGLGLVYLLYFLPRSAESHKLTEFCRRHTLAPRSQEFPNRSKRSRRAIADYLKREQAGKD